jgi:hypothetical protein
MGGLIVGLAVLVKKCRPEVLSDYTEGLGIDNPSTASADVETTPALYGFNLVAVGIARVEAIA